MSVTARVYLVDDDAAIRDALYLLLQLRGINVELFSNAADAIGWITNESRGCVLTDLRMPGQTGLELMAQLRARHISLPVVVLTAHGDVATTRAALRGGAFDFLEKPIDEDILVDVVRHAINEDAKGHLKRLEVDANKARIDSLTPRELEVFLLLSRGLQNREVAIELSISARTVEVYKARMMEKLGCSTIAEVVKLSLMVELGPQS
jgi:two-component system response regulator FixJ